MPLKFLKWSSTTTNLSWIRSTMQITFTFFPSFILSRAFHDLHKFIPIILILLQMLVKLFFSNRTIDMLYNSNKYFFSIRVFFTDSEDSQDSRGREGMIFYFTLPLPPTHEHWDIYLQLCIWDDYHVFLIATLAFTRLLLDDIYHLIELPFEWLIDDAMFVCLLDALILG